MQETRKKAAKNRVVRIPVEKLLEEDEWLSITNINRYSSHTRVVLLYNEDTGHQSQIPEDNNVRK